MAGPESGRLCVDATQKAVALAVEIDCHFFERQPLAVHPESVNDRLPRRVRLSKPKTVGGDRYETRPLLPILRPNLAEASCQR